MTASPTPDRASGQVPDRSSESASGTASDRASGQAPDRSSESASGQAPDRDFVACLADVWAALAAIGHGLDEAGWQRPTDCPGWRVQEHYAHIVGTESSLAGRPAPAPAPPAPHVRNPIGEYNEAWVAAWSDRPGAELLAALEEVTAERLDALRAMTDEELAAPGPSPIGRVPYATFMDVRAMDCWVHEQDVRSALGMPWRFDGPAAGPAMDRLAATFGYAVGKRVAPPDGTVVVLAVTGPHPRTLAVEMRDGRATSVAPPPSPTVRIDTDTETWVRLVTGRCTPAAVATRVHVDGEAALGAAVQANLGQMP